MTSNEATTVMRLKRKREEQAAETIVVELPQKRRMEDLSLSTTQEEEEQQQPKKQGRRKVFKLIGSVPASVNSGSCNEVDQETEKLVRKSIRSQPENPITAGSSAKRATNQRKEARFTAAVSFRTGKSAESSMLGMLDLNLHPAKPQPSIVCNGVSLEIAPTGSQKQDQQEEVIDIYQFFRDGDYASDEKEEETEKTVPTTRNKSAVVILLESYDESMFRGCGELGDGKDDLESDDDSDYVPGEDDDSNDEDASQNTYPEDESDDESLNEFDDDDEDEEYYHSEKEGNDEDDQ